MKSKNERKPRSGLRGMARLCAVQVLYSNDFCNYDIERIINEFNKDGQAFISESISIIEMDRDFFCKLLKTVSKNILSIDVLVSKKLSKNWRIDRLDPVVKCILRLGITELMYFQEIPSNVIFNEYIEISKAFFEANEVSFVNGLLNEVSKEVRI